MSDYIDGLVRRVEGAMACDRLEKRTDQKNLKAVLWEIRAECWEDGVMWKGGIWTIRPERPLNPYLIPQPSLFDEPKVIPARSTDPDTSHRATEEIKVRAGTQRARLLAVFPPNVGLTDEEAMEAAIGVSPLSEYAKRCSELREAGFIEPTGETRKGASGMERIVSRITAKGRAWIEANQ